MFYLNKKNQLQLSSLEKVEHTAGKLLRVNPAAPTPKEMNVYYAAK